MSSDLHLEAFAYQGRAQRGVTTQGDTPSSATGPEAKPLGPATNGHPSNAASTGSADAQGQSSPVQRGPDPHPHPHGEGDSRGEVNPDAPMDASDTRTHAAGGDGGATDDDATGTGVGDDAPKSGATAAAMDEVGDADEADEGDGGDNGDDNDEDYRVEDDEDDDDDDDEDDDDEYHNDSSGGHGQRSVLHGSSSGSGSDEPAGLRSERHAGNGRGQRRFNRPSASAAGVPQEAIANPELFGLRRSGRARRQRRDYLEELYQKEEEEREANRAARRRQRAARKRAGGGRRGGGGGGRRGRRRNSDSSDDSSQGGFAQGDSDSDEEWGGGRTRGRQQRRQQPQESDESSESEGWVPGSSRSRSKKRSRGRRQQRSRRGGGDGANDEWVPQRVSFRNTRTVNYRETDSEDELDSEEEMAAAARHAAKAEDTRDRIHLIVICKKRHEVVTEMRHLFSLQAMIHGQEELPSGKTVEEVQADIDDSLISILGKEPTAADELEQGGEDDDDLFCINWVGQSHIHNTWHTERELREMDIAGIKKFDNFLREMRQRQSVLDDAKTTTEDMEYYNCQLEMHYEALAKHKVVERIVLNRSVGNPQSWEDNDEVEYLCKWFGLDYDANTWEPANLICPRFQTLVDEYLERQNSNTLPSSSHRRQREPFKIIKQQPSWLPDPELQLRDYQMQGVSWLARSWCDGNSVILADEMGLGKTIQSIMFLSYLFHVQQVYGPFLIVVPLSTIMAWSRELHKWAPNMNTIVYVGNKAARQAICRYEFFNDRRRVKFNVLLTTYEKVNTNLDDLMQIRWAALLVDEAHRLKNHESCLHQSLSDLKHDFRLLITGTPLQNSMKELWALLHFIMPKTFSSWEEFEERYGGLGDDVAENHKVLRTLHEDIKPYLIRRVKKDVEKSLPKKVEKILRVGLSQAQKQIYKHIITKNYTALRNLQKGQKSSLVNVIMELKKCCNHAALIDQQPLSNPDVSPTENMRNLLKGSGKLILLDKLLQRLREKGHRVLIFSQMVMMLDVLATYLMMKGFPFQRLDGNIPNERRKQAIDHFNAPDSQDFCFILSTRAGGLGVNLATADTVIIFDSDWNPQNDLQAQARAHRIGQTKQVNIYRFVSKQTVEEDILERAKKKMVLDHLVIQRMDTTGSSLLNLRKKKSAGVEYNKEELDAIIKFGAADLFGEQDGSAGSGGGAAGGETAGDQDLKLDLDTVLQQAETHDTQEAATGMSDELLSAFKTVDIETNEDELDEAAKAAAEEEAAVRAKEETEAKEKAKQAAAASMGNAASWDEILPEHVRLKAEQEAHEREMQKLILPPRKRKQPVMYADEQAHDDDDDDDAAVGAAASRSKPKPLKELEEAKVGKFTAEEVRNLVIAVRKYGSFENRADVIVAEANMEKRDRAEVQRLLDWLSTQCSERRKKLAKEKDAAKKKDLRRLSLGKQVINAEDFLFRIEGLSLLHTLIRKAKGPFRVHTKVKMPKWDCSWKPTDDANLLVGVDKYGLGAWDKIKADPALKLSSSILQGKGKKPQETHLKGRVETLLKELIKTKLRRPLQMASPAKKRASAHSQSKKTKQASVKSMLEKKNTKKAAKKRGAGDDSDDEFEKNAVTMKLVEGWMAPVKSHLRVLGDESATVKKKSKAIVAVGDHVTRMKDKHAASHDKAELKAALWTYVGKQTVPDDAEAQGKTLRKVYRSLSGQKKGADAGKSSSGSADAAGGARAKAKTKGAGGEKKRQTSSSPAAQRSAGSTPKQRTPAASAKTPGTPRTPLAAAHKGLRPASGGGKAAGSAKAAKMMKANAQSSHRSSSSSINASPRANASKQTTAATGAAGAKTAGAGGKRGAAPASAAKRAKMAGQTTLDRYNPNK